MYTYNYIYMVVMNVTALPYYFVCMCACIALMYHSTHLSVSYVRSYSAYRCMVKDTDH